MLAAAPLMGRTSDQEEDEPEGEEAGGPEGRRVGVGGDGAKGHGLCTGDRCRQAGRGDRQPGTNVRSIGLEPRGRPKPVP